MRKIKSERNTKKLKNSVNDFYYSWIRHPAINERLKDLSNKEVVNMTGKLKNVVEKLYLDLKVEEKYMYYVNLYNLYELICVYFMKKNKLLERLETLTGNKCVSDKIKNKEDIDIIQNYFGYETAFDTFINKKADDTLHWLYSSLSEIVKHYIGRVKDDNINILTKEIEIIIKENYNIYNRNEEQIQKEIIYIDEILRRIKYAKENVNIIYSIGYKEQNKKLRTMIKSSLTRAEKLMKLVIDEIENAYAA